MTNKEQKSSEASSPFPLSNNSDPNTELKTSSFQLLSFANSVLKFVSSYSIVCREILVGLLIGFAFTAVGAGAGASILSGITAGALVFYVYRFIYKIELKPNKNARQLGQAIVGLSIGISLSPSHILDMVFQLPILIFPTLFLLLCSFIIGYIALLNDL